jgi:hypothetical protein
MSSAPYNTVEKEDMLDDPVIFKKVCSLFDH